MNNQVTFFEDTAEGWERALYAFLAEKERRSGSRRTVESYSRMIQHFFGRLGKPPDKVKSQEVFAWAHGKGLSGKEPSAVTIGARMACMSSFYKFLIRMEIVASNPCDALERPRVPESTARGLSAEQIQQLLAVIPESKTGLRDRAIILTLTLTGRRRTELLSLCIEGIDRRERRAVVMGKGARQRIIGFEAKTLLTLQRYHRQAGIKDGPLFRSRTGEPLSQAALYLAIRRRGEQAGIEKLHPHTFRHCTATRLLEAGMQESDVRTLLGWFARVEDAGALYGFGSC